RRAGGGRLDAHAAAREPPRRGRAAAGRLEPARPPAGRGIVPAFGCGVDQSMHTGYQQAVELARRRRLALTLRMWRSGEEALARVGLEELRVGYDRAIGLAQRDLPDDDTMESLVRHYCERGGTGVAAGLAARDGLARVLRDHAARGVGVDPAPVGGDRQRVDDRAGRGRSRGVLPRAQILELGLDRDRPAVAEAPAAPGRLERQVG